MRTLIVGVPLLVVVAVLQSSFLNTFRFLEGGFDALLVIVLAWNLVRRNGDAPVWGFIAGLLMDILSGGLMGAHTFAMTMVTLAVALTEGYFYQSNWALALLISLMGTVWFHLLYLFMLSVAGRQVPWADALTYNTLPSAILNLILMLPVYRLTAQVARLAEPKELGLLDR